MIVRSTHTYAVLEISQSAWDEIAAKLRAASYGHAFVDATTIDMHGIGLQAEAAGPRKPFITRAEAILASRLLDQAATEFHEHGCNDMDPEYFEGLTPKELFELEAGYNAWKRGETGETCGDPKEGYTKVHFIGDDMWMAYLAAVIGRKS